MFGKKMRKSRRAKNAAMDVVPAEPRSMTLDELVEEESSFDVLAAADAEYNGIQPAPAQDDAADEFVELEPFEEAVEQPVEQPVAEQEEPAETPEEEAPVEEQPEEVTEEIEEAPAEEKAEDTPVEESEEDGEEQPADEAPVEEAPVEENAETPVEEAPVEEAPVEEAPIEEAPVEETPAEENAEEVPSEEGAEEAPAEEGAEENAEGSAEEEASDEPEYEPVDGADDELSVPRLVNLPNLIDYMTGHNSSKHMKLSVGLLLASGYNKVKDDPDEKKLMLKSMAITLKSLMNTPSAKK